MGSVIAVGTACSACPPVAGPLRRLDTPEDVLALMDEGTEGVVALVGDAGATFLAPVFEELAAVVCRSGTPESHVGIVAREYGVPAVMGTAFGDGEPPDGAVVTVDCSQAPEGVVRA